MPESNPATAGVILAGGLARRMGGGDKALIRIGGRTILERVLARLRPQCRALVLNAAGDLNRFADIGLPAVTDSVPGFAGPLAGILAGLDWAAANAPDIAWLASVPGDCPFLPSDLVARLHGAREKAGARLACARSGERRHPVIALWPVALREELRRAVAIDGVRKVEEWASRYPLGVAEWPAEPFDPFFNINTPADIAEAERTIVRHPEI